MIVLSKKNRIYVRNITLKYVVFGLLLCTSCSKTEDPITEDPTVPTVETPVEPPVTTVDTEAPTIVLTNITVIDNDGDGLINDVTGTITVSDNIAIDGAATYVNIGDIDGVITGNTFVVSDVPVGTNTIDAGTTDTSGNSETTTTSVVIADQISESFISATTIITNDINEETAGKIGSFTTVNTKITITNGATTENSVTDGTTTYELTGADADLLEIKGNEVHVKEGFAKDVEDENGNDVEANKTYVWGITTEYHKTGNTAEADATDTDEAVSNNVDVADHSPLISGKQLTDTNGNLIIVEAEDTKKVYPKYQAVIEIYNPDNKEAINNGSVQVFIDGSNGVFEAHVFDDGDKFAKIIAGSNAGKLISRAAIEKARYALSEILTSPTNGDFLTVANTNLGNLYSQIADNSDAFTTHIGSTNGLHFLTPIDNDKIAALTAVLVAKELGEDL